MSGKDCPRCGHRVPLGQFVRLTSHRLACRQCGTTLNTNVARLLLAAAIASVPLGFLISKSIHDPVWWIGVVVTMAASHLVYYCLFGVRVAPESKGYETQV